MNVSPRAATWLVAAVGAGVIALSLSHRAKGYSKAAPLPASLAENAVVLHVPRARGNIALDGDLDDPGWVEASARTGVFVGDDGVTHARPHSEARLVWTDGYLYMGLYAADDDLHARGEHDALAPDDDVFHVVFTDGKIERVIDVTPTGVIRDGTRPAGSRDPLALEWDCHAHVSVEHDGTLNDPRDHDEEWVIEMAIPLEALGLHGESGEALGLSFRRCDTFRSGGTSCGSWGIADESPAPPDRGLGRGVMVLD